MRPRYAPQMPYEPPRWRSRRLRDLRDIAGAYSIAIIVVVATLMAMASYPEWFFDDLDQLVRAMRVALAIGLYVGSGALLIALVVHRMAAWHGMRLMPMRPVRWFTFLAWPLLVGALLFQLASPMPTR